MAEDEKSPNALQSVLDELPVDRLREELGSGASALGDKAMDFATDRISDLTGKLTDFADGGGVIGGAAKEGMEESAEGGSPVKGALTGAVSGAKDKVKEKLGGGGGGGGSKRTKATNIIEAIEVGVPVHVAYNQWTEFQEFSGFMKKVESVEQKDETTVSWKAKIVWSHRTWEAQILEQVPDERIVWRSQGEKGHVDGAVTFHELAPNLTRILVVLEYHPQGFFEKTGNIWRAQGRRVRAELGNFQRHVMTDVIQDWESVEGWRGEINEGEVERSHEEVLDEEQEEGQAEDQPEGAASEGESEEEPEGEYEEEEPEGEYEDEYEEPAEEEPEGEYEEEPAEGEYEYEEEPEAEYEEEPAEDEAEYEEEPAEGEYEEEPAEEYEEEPEEEPEDEPEEKPKGSRRGRRKR